METANSNTSQERLTVAEAARRLDVSERSIYRLLKEPNFAGRTLTEHRQTVTGRRLTTMLPVDVLAELEEHFSIYRTVTNNDGATVTNVGNDDDNNDGRIPANGDNGDSGSVLSVADPRLVILYERQLADKDAEIAFLRTQLQLAQENLAREQALRALAAPQTSRERPSDAPESILAGENRKSAEPAESSAAEEKPRHWWRRMWRGRAQ